MGACMVGYAQNARRKRRVQRKGEKVMYGWKCPDCGRLIFPKEILKHKGDSLKPCKGTGVHFQSSVTSLNSLEIRDGKANKDE